MTTCASCGREIGEDFALCPYCGASLAAPSPDREQRKRVTILFCDVAGSTALGESTDPEAVRTLLARYFQRMKGIIESHGGTVEKFIGDAVMAVFGVPAVHEDDALRAVRAASEMQGAVGELGLQVRIGITSGEVVTGTAERLATGDAVNVAARLEQAAAPGAVLLGDETLRLVRDMVDIEAVPPFELKGKREPVTAYRLLRLKNRAERPRMTPMIGRERELRRVQGAFAQAVDDRSCRLFTILGTAGVGKSRLAAEFLGGMDGAHVVRGRCLSYGEGITYWPVVEVLRQIAAMPSDPYAAAALQSLLGESPVLASAEEIAWGFRKLLEEQAAEQPLVVAFDDIHWAEETFLDLVEQVADLARDAPILLLCMARPELLEKRSSWGQGKPNTTTVVLDALDARETDRLLDALGGVGDGLRERIQEVAEGNPLFVEEMVSLIKESGGEEVVVPPTIQTVLSARLDQLEPAERTVLECGAVEGRVFHRGAVHVLAQNDGKLQETLGGLVRKELVQPARADVSGDEAYRFRHELIRDATYDSTAKAVRARLHERFAAWLEERGVELVELDEIVGYHLEQAARYKQELLYADHTLEEQAGERLGAAGRRALWRGDNRAAKGLLERALALLRPLRLDVYLELDLADLQPTVPDATAMHEMVAERARAANNPRGEAVAKVVATLHHVMSGTASNDSLETLVRQTLPLLEEAEDHSGLVRVSFALGSVAINRGHLEEWAQATEKTIFYARLIGQPGLFGLPSALVLGPRPADAALHTLDLLLTDEPHPDARRWRAVLLAMLGRFDEAWAESDEASRLLSELAVQMGGGDLAPGFIATLQGDREAAVRYWQAACTRLEEQGNHLELSTFAPVLGRSLCMLGRYDEAEPLAQLGRELGDEQDVATQILWRQAQALVLAGRGEYEEAERLAREAVRIADEADSLDVQGDTLCDLAEVLEKAGRPEEARATLKQALERYERKKNLAMVAQVRQRLGVGEDSVPLA